MLYNSFLAIPLGNNISEGGKDSPDICSNCTESILLFSTIFVVLVTIRPFLAKTGLTTDNTPERSANLPYCASDYSLIVPTSCIKLQSAAVISFDKIKKYIYLRL